MSITGLGNAGFANPLAGLLGPSSAAEPGKAGPADPAEAAAAKAEASKARNRAVLEEIREKGIYAWAQEQKLKKLEEKAREQVLADRGMTEADLARMPESARTAAETSIQEAIAQIVKESLEKALASKSAPDADGQVSTGPMIIDISV